VQCPKDHFWTLALSREPCLKWRRLYSGETFCSYPLLYFCTYFFVVFWMKQQRRSLCLYPGDSLCEKKITWQDSYIQEMRIKKHFKEKTNLLTVSTRKKLWGRRLLLVIYNKATLLIYRAAILETNKISFQKQYFFEKVTFGENIRICSWGKCIHWCTLYTSVRLCAVKVVGIWG